MENRGKIGVTTENIFPVIKQFLYSDHEIFLRELVANAVDASQKMKALARRSALTFKAQQNQIMVVENFTFDAPKTKDFVNITKNLKIEGKKVLFVLPSQDKNVYLSARNIKKAKVMSAALINTYSVLDAEVLVIAESSLKDIDAVLGK